MTEQTAQVIQVPRSEQAACALVERTRRRGLGRLRSAQPAQHLGEVYWPLALVWASAAGTGRRQWREGLLGAVDLVTGRPGIVDVALPPLARQHVATGRIPPRVPRDRALLTWHDFHRDHVDRRRKPFRPPRLTVDRVELAWLPHQLVGCGTSRYLVDTLVRRVDPLEDFPYVREQVTADPQPEEVSP